MEGRQCPWMIALQSFHKSRKNVQSHLILTMLSDQPKEPMSTPKLRRSTILKRTLVEDDDEHPEAAMEPLYIIGTMVAWWTETLVRSTQRKKALAMSARSGRCGPTAALRVQLELRSSFARANALVYLKTPICISTHLHTSPTYLRVLLELRSSLPGQSDLVH